MWAFFDFGSEGDAAAKIETLTQSDTDDAPVVRFINQVIVQAINRGASDIHFEPYEKPTGCAFARMVCLMRSTFSRHGATHGRAP